MINEIKGNLENIIRELYTLKSGITEVRKNQRAVTQLKSNQ